MSKAAGIAFVTPTLDLVLLAQRSEHVSHPGTWGVPGGGVEYGESDLQAALREVEEELGLDRREVMRRAQFIGYVKTSKRTGHNRSFVTFVAMIDPDWLEQNIDLDLSENTAVAWFDVFSDVPDDENLHYGVVSIWERMQNLLSEQIK